MDDSGEDADIHSKVNLYFNKGIICFSTEKQIMPFCALFKKERNKWDN